MGELRDRMEADLKIGGYSPATQKIYLLYARQFAAHFHRSPAEMGADEVRQFLLHLVDQRQVSPNTLRQVRSALRFLFAVTLNRPVEIEWLPSPRRHRPLPVILSGTEVTALLAAVRCVKYRTILTVMYASGLRISEACRLEIGDVDARRRVLRIRHGKGGVDRYTLLSERLLAVLRDYWRRCRPGSGWLFPGKTAAGCAGTESVRKIFHQAVATAGIAKAVTPHSLRHSFATHLVDAGDDITTVQALLGHASLRATETYSHVTVERIVRTRSPFDLLGTPDAAIFG